mgnify:CR=1 FL=1
MARASTLEAGAVAEAAAEAVRMLNHLTLASPSDGTRGWRTWAISTACGRIVR